MRKKNDLFGFYFCHIRLKIKNRSRCLIQSEYSFASLLSLKNGGLQPCFSAASSSCGVSRGRVHSFQSPGSQGGIRIMGVLKVVKVVKLSEGLIAPLPCLRSVCV